ncbi:hypothetical protein [Streptomyces sp. 8P21H-1]|uniref:hypothetical protein n=1 Tax=Streptomyces sp. 8P21H-1 TaxID=2737048 RepID=UPI00156DBD30|nr:hypothetical protein [Streptomyces sp. 8P21H-1]NSL42708.1 hypothetical protein [Streptomyces sp. 8P21H-1]
MTGSKQEIALVTPVATEIQQEALAFVADGHEAKAVKCLRKASGLGLSEAQAALQLLRSGRALPIDYPQALENLEALDSDLMRELSSSLAEGDNVKAVKVLRERMDLSLTSGYRLIKQLEDREAS